METIYLGFVQQLDRYADGARHGEFDDAEFLSERGYMLRTAVARLYEYYENVWRRLCCEGRTVQHSVVGMLRFGERPSFVGFGDALPSLSYVVQCISGDQYMNHYIFRSTGREPDERFRNIQYLQIAS